MSCTQEKVSREEKEMNVFIDDLMSKMTLEEKVGQTVLFSSWWDVTGPVPDNDFVNDAKQGRVGGVFNALTADFLYRLQKEVVDNSRLGIPLLFGYDVIHGYRTTFPTPLAMSCSWDMDLVELATSTMAQEAAADGLHWTFAPMVDISRDPRWGRVAEGAGEDAFLGSQIAKAQVKGIQGDDVSDTTKLLACVKHFAAYGAPVAGRDYNSVDMSERHLREFYLPPYKAAIDAGCQTIMASFNDINGVPATSNKWLLTDLLRDEWNFKGMVVTDYTGVMELMHHGTVADSADAAAQSINAGVDMDMQSGFFMNHMLENVKKGVVSEETVNTACRRVLEMKYKKGLFEDPFKYCSKDRAKRWLKKPEFFERSRKVAKSSIVLLKNEKNILPLSKNTPSIALIGPMASNKRNQLGAWHTGGREETVTPIDQAFLKEFPSAKIRIAKGCDYVGQDRSGFAKARAAAKVSDVVVMCMGEQEFESGEAASKTDIRLASIQRELIREIARLGKPMVLLLHNGRPVILSEEEKYFDGILEVWHLGSMAGPAIADVVSGDYNPSGKLTMSFPRNMGQIPVYYNYLNTGRPISKERFTSKYTDCPNTPMYPFGYGLSYTNFEYSPIRLSGESMNADGQIEVTVTIKNTGEVDGEEVVQMYIRDLVASVSRPVKELKGFQKVMIPAGESVEVSFTIDRSLLSFHNTDLQYVAEPGDFKVFIGGSSVDVKEADFRLN
jgi:beta-glucosidase